MKKDETIGMKLTALVESGNLFAGPEVTDPEDLAKPDLGLSKEEALDQIEKIDTLLLELHKETIPLRKTLGELFSVIEHLHKKKHSLQFHITVERIKVNPKNVAILIPEFANPAEFEAWLAELSPSELQQVAEIFKNQA